NHNRSVKRCFQDTPWKRDRNVGKSGLCLSLCQEFLKQCQSRFGNLVLRRIGNKFKDLLRAIVVHAHIPVANADTVVVSLPDVEDQAIDKNVPYWLKLEHIRAP